MNGRIYPFLGTFVIAVFCAIGSCFGFPEFGISKAALAKGEWFTIFTFMFIHQGAEHLIINLAALILAGAIANEIGFSNKAFLAIFFTVGLTSVFLALPFTSSILAGASAGIYGIFGAMAVKLGDYGMSVPKVLGVLAIAAAGSSLIETPLVNSTETVLRLSVHLAALFLGAIFFLGARRKWVPRGRRLARKVSAMKHSSRDRSHA